MLPTRQCNGLAVLILGAVVSSSAWAVTLPAFDLPQIGSIDAPKTAKAGASVQITVKAAKDGTSTCGLVVSFGDGSEQVIKVNADNTKLPVSVEHAYKKAGKFTVQAKGRKVTTHHSCGGTASAAIRVTSAKKSGTPAKSKQ